MLIREVATSSAVVNQITYLTVIVGKNQPTQTILATRARASIFALN